MPHITFEGSDLPKEKKKQLVEQFTDIASDITGIPKDAFVVIIKENTLENIGVGGKLLADREK